MMNFTRFTPLLISVFVLVGCAVNPNPPQGKPMQPAPAALPSQIEVPLAVRYKVIEDELNKAVPEKIFFASGQQFDCPFKRCTWQLGVRRNGPITIAANVNGGLTLSIPVASHDGRVDVQFFLTGKQGDAKIKGKSDEIEPKGGTHADIKVEIKVKPTVKIAINADWTLKPDVSLDFDVDVADVVIKGIQISTKTKLREALNSQKANLQHMVAKAVSSVDFKSQVAQAWSNLNGTIKLAENPPVWVAVAPLTVVAEQPRFASSNLTLGVGVGAFFHTYAQTAKPTPTRPAPLPDLKIVDKVSGAYQIALPVSVSVNLANQVLTDLIGKEFVFPIGHKNVAVVLVDGRAYVNGSDLVIYAKVKAPGVVMGVFPITVGAYLNGTPQYDGTSRSVVVKPFDFDMDTNNLLLDKAEWMLHGKLKESIQELLVFKVGEKIDVAKNELSNALKEMRISDKMVLRGTIEELSVDSVYTTESNLNVDVTAKGGISATLE